MVASFAWVVKNTSLCMKNKVAILKRNLWAKPSGCKRHSETGVYVINDYLHWSQWWQCQPRYPQQLRHQTCSMHQQNSSASTSNKDTQKRKEKKRKEERETTEQERKGRRGKKKKKRRQLCKTERGKHQNVVIWYKRVRLKVNILPATASVRKSIC